MFLQPLLNLLQVLRAINLNNAIHFRRIAHELLRAGVQHLDFSVAGYREVVEHDVWDGEAAGVL